MGAKGVDRSHHDGPVNWAAHKNAGIEFAWCKCTESAGDTLFVDPTWAGNRDGARAAGIAVGPYHFGRPAVDPRQSARDFKNAAGWRPGDLPPVLDTEAADGYSAAHVHWWVHEFADELAQPMIQYTGQWFWDSAVTRSVCVQCTPRPLWLGPNHPMPGTWAAMAISQTYNVTVAGITGDFNDLKVGTVANLVAYGQGGNQPTPTPDPNSDDQEMENMVLFGLARTPDGKVYKVNYLSGTYQHVPNADVLKGVIGVLERNYKATQWHTQFNTPDMDRFGTEIPWGPVA